LVVPKLRERPATYEDLLKVPDNMVAEIVEGELFASPRPANPHMRAAGRIYGLISGSFDGGDDSGEWWILFEPEVHLDRDVLVPDIGGWRRERMPEIPYAASIDVAPDWVCEVLSPSTARLDRFYKLPRYAKHLVTHAWIVDPVIRGIEVYRLDGPHYKLVATFEGDQPVRIEPFESVELPLRMLWSGLAAPPQ
jgi:Uma2 family endonuclease